MFGIYLREAEYFGVGEFSTESLREECEVFDFVGREGETLLTVVLFKIVDMYNLFGATSCVENALVKAVVSALEHTVIFGSIGVGFDKLFDTGNSVDTHVGGHLDGICAPWCNHFGPRSDVASLQRFAAQCLGSGKQPYEAADVFFRNRLVTLYCNDTLGILLEKCDHAG